MVKVVDFSALDHSTLSGNVDKQSSACGCVGCFSLGTPVFVPLTDPFVSLACGTQN